MRVLLVHLSDIHIRTEVDAVLGRGELIANAAGSVDYDPELCVLVVTGDIAYSGTDEQYMLAESFLTSVATKLQDIITSHKSEAQVCTVVVPGNHDCDFSESGQARDIIADGIPRTPAQTRDKSIVEICLGVQDSFWSFANSLPAAGDVETNEAYDERLYREHVFKTETGTLRFRCCNTAFLSRMHERQGTLYFPSDAIPPERTPDSLTIAVFHHPYNWLEATVARRFRKATEKTSDLVLTGHEHDSARRTQKDDTGAENTYIEGGVLQDSDAPDASIFNVISVDTAEQKQKFTRFSWDGERYSRDDASIESWEEFRLNKLRAKGTFEFNERARVWLDDPEVTLAHPYVDNVRLSDIYVFPDLREVTLPSQKGKFVNGNAVLDFVCSEQVLLVTGDTQSGKTGLAKMLMLGLRARDEVPVFLDADLNIPKGEQLHRYLEGRFIAQYESGEREAYRQLDSRRRVAIVDNYERLRLPKKEKQRWLDTLEKFCGRIVLIAHEVILDIEDMTRPDSSSCLVRYAIQPLGHARRNSLVEKWLLLGGRSDSDAVQFAHNLTAVTRTLDSLIGRNFVPAYPPYVLSVVQASEALSPVDTSATTHGYFYELFIRTSLAKGRTGVQYDILMAYLAHFAYRLFTVHSSEISVPAAKETHRDYEARYDQELEFQETLRTLASQRILEVSNDEVSFKYKYVYYYFVASYLRDHISEEAIRSQITEIAGTLHVEEHANIMLFLAHLSKDPLIVGEMLKAARKLYPGVLPARLDDDIAFLDDLARLSAEVVVYKDADHRREREDQLEALDREQHLADAAGNNAILDPMDPIVRVGVMLKTLQILGQIVKNFPGSLDGNIKTEIVTECYGLGLRALGEIMGTLRAEQVGVLQMFADMIKRIHPGYKDDRVIKRAQNTLVGLAGWASLGIVKRIAFSVGSPNLTATYSRVTDKAIPAHLLIQLSVHLDHVGKFPMAQVRDLAGKFLSKAMASWVLRSLCVQHFRVFPIDPRTKQTACAALGIAYQQLETSEPVKLLKAR